VAILAGAAIDHKISSDRLTPFNATDTVALQEGFNHRVGLYLVGLALAVAYVCIAALRSGSVEPARVFTNLGIAGVCVLIGTVAAMLWATAGGIELPRITPWLLSAGMLASAAIGRLATLRAVPPGRLFPWQTSIALGITAVASLIAVSYAYAQPDCGSGLPVADFPALFPPLVVAGLVMGLACLATRRWIAGLVTVVVNPFVFLAAAAASCAFYS
jgi:hypothetical protein